MAGLAETGQSVEAERLRGLIEGRTVILGIGNLLRGDDGLGPALIDRLKGRSSATCIDAGSAPENHMSPVIRAKPDTVVVVDAAQLGLPPGACQVLSHQDLVATGLTTHTMSLRMMVQFLQAHTTARIHFVAVQPATLEFGADLSPAVARTLDRLAALWSDEGGPPVR